jgi:vancomycin resistance protein YoaR
MQNRAWKLADPACKYDSLSPFSSRERLLLFPLKFSSSLIPHMTQIKSARTQMRVISLGRAKLIALTCLPLLFFALFFARFAAKDEVVARLTVAGVKLGGASRAEARRRLLERRRALGQEKLRLTLANKEASLALDELGMTLAVDESVLRALGVARSAGTFSNALRYLRSIWYEQNLEAALHVDRARFDAAVAKLELALIDDPPFPGAIEITAGVARGLPPRPGRKIAVEAVLGACSAAVALGHTREPVALTVVMVASPLASGSLERALNLATRVMSRRVELTAGERRLAIEPAALGALLVSNVQGQELALAIDSARLDAWLAARRGALETPARDAGFEVSAEDAVRVTPGAAGVRLAADAVAKALWIGAQSDEHRGELPLLQEPLPARSTEQAEKLRIRALVGSFTTRHPCCQPRVDNIHRIATLIDGLVVEPGQTVSVNAVVGPRTQKNGFVLAPSIEDGEMVDTVGGGVSQFATTIFNALFHAGYDIIERQPHTYWFPRYPMGHDATLGFPRPDIVFKNDSDAGLLVKTSFTKTTITVKLYGDTGGRKVSSSVSERRDVVQPTLELLPNRDVSPDEEQVKEGGMIGWSVIASRTVTFADGTKKEEKRKVTYKPKPRRVEVHPCRIPKGEPGATGERCPEPPPEEEAPAPDAQPSQRP